MRDILTAVRGKEAAAASLHNKQPMIKCRAQPTKRRRVREKKKGGKDRMESIEVENIQM